MIKNCLNCKHCSQKGYTTSECYGFGCEMKRKYFDYNFKQLIKGILCIFYEEKEVKDDGKIKN